MPDVHWCVTVDYQQIVDSKIANKIHGFTIDYGKFILIHNSNYSVMATKINIDGGVNWCI